MKQTSAATSKSPEPSMEEILASIRRIIADDGEGTKAPAPPKPVARDAPEALEAEWEAAARDAPAAPSPFPAPEPDEDDDVLDLAEMAPPRSPTLDLDGEDVSFGDASAVDFDAIAIDDEPEPAPPPPPREEFARVEPARPEPPRDSAAERLLSGQADAHVSRAFNMLATTVLTNNARTLEDLVKDMLKPLLKAWLDDNLPPLVERLVRAEIERVARGGS